MKKTKIVCTIGPVSESVEVLSNLLKSGMNVMRMNFSHGSHEEHKQRIENLHKAIKNTGINAAVLLDTKGPEIRTIKLKDGKDVHLTAGQKFIITTDTSVIGDSTKVAVTYKGLTNDLKVGNIVLIDDGLLEMEVQEIKGNEIVCLVKNNGDLGENKGVNLPNVSVQLPALSPKDIEDLKFGCEQKVDYVAASFIRKAEDVKAVREVLEKNGGRHIKIISKIENQEGLDNFDEILELSDGIMVARGDLGVEIAVEEVPFAQKMMIEKCNIAGKIVITATQMLDSMIKNPRPTRAEATDVTNAILDGTDAIMLSGETAKGHYPVEAVNVMRKISQKTDPLVKFEIVNEEEAMITEAIAKGVVDVADTLKAKLIVTATATGRSAIALRRYFPEAYILAVTNNEITYNQMILIRGVIPYLSSTSKSLDEFYSLAEEKGVELELVKSGDIIIASCGDEVFKMGTSNSMKVIKIK